MSDAASNTLYDGDAHARLQILTIGDLLAGHDRVSKFLKGVHDFLGTSDMLAYLSMMALRLIELRRVLKPTGPVCLYGKGESC